MAKQYRVRDIPADWRPWIDIAKNRIKLRQVCESAHNFDPKVGLLVGACLSAAKWITGNPEDFGLLPLQFCGLCHRSIKRYRPGSSLRLAPCNPDNGVGCLLQRKPDQSALRNCVDRAAAGEAMEVYTKLFDDPAVRVLYDRWQAEAEGVPQ
jgi:hypothetical protein